MTHAFKRGYDAYLQGTSIDDNFYSDGSDESLQWLEGFLEAERFDSVKVDYDY